MRLVHGLVRPHGLADDVADFEVAAMSAQRCCPARPLLHTLWHRPPFMVVDEKLESLREATEEDVGGALQLIGYWDNGSFREKLMLNPVSRDQRFGVKVKIEGKF